MKDLCPSASSCGRLIGDLFGQLVGVSEGRGNLEAAPRSARYRPPSEFSRSRLLHYLPSKIRQVNRVQGRAYLLEKLSRQIMFMGDAKNIPIHSM